MTDSSIAKRQWPAALFLFVALAVAAFAYQPGKGGSLHFDDPHNLEGLRKVVDSASAVDFAVSGDSGPTGRPLALASFAPQAYAWPNSPEVLLSTNICLHLLNGALVVWLLYLLCVARRPHDHRAAWVAAASGAIWMLLPILASSSLFIVQRMTVLSSTFLLLGFIGYLYGRTVMTRRPLVALTLMSASLGIGTVLAVLTKENGALLPVLVLVAELTLLQSPITGRLERLWRAWVAVFLVAPAIVLLGYLALVRYDASVVLIRGFSGPERLLTEASVLWQYLYRAFVPTLSSLGPFHDDVPVHRDWLDPLSLLAVFGWLVAVAAAIAFRKRLPWFSFAVAWYLVGHLLESTTVALELYFEHRNYVPLIGPAVALVATLANVAPPWKRVAEGALAAYAAALSLVLFNATSLWGKPPLAAEMWAKYHPDSLRAILYHSQALQDAGHYQTARDVLSAYAEKHPNSGSVPLQMLSLSCGIEPEKPQPELLASLQGVLANSSFEYAVFNSLQRLRELAHQGECDAVLNGETIYTLAAITERNPTFHAQALMRHNLHVLMAEEAIEQRNLDLTMQHIEAALDAYYTVTTLDFAVATLNSAGLESVSAEFLRDARSRAPKHALQAARWKEQIAVLEKATEEAARHE